MAKRAVAVAAIALATLGVAIDVGDAGDKAKPAPAPDTARGRFLGFTQKWRNQPGSRRGVAGRSAQGRRIRIVEYGIPEINAEVLVVGCIHGTECAGRAIKPLGPSGCPPADADIYFLPNLNPDGYALGSRLNGRGVDLNRNFPAEWKRIGSRGSPQHSGRRPFSEPETRLAARLIRNIGPEVTIWFHQQPGKPFVRAWGPSIPTARRYAKLAGMPFRELPWLAGTAPNWQNHRFPGTASFVVELPPGQLSKQIHDANRRAIVELARRIAVWR